MSENCDLKTAAVVVIGPGESLSSGIVQKFVYHAHDKDSFAHEFESALKEVRKMIRSRWLNFYGGKTLAVFNWYYDSFPLEKSHFIRFIKIQNVKEFKL